jgi:hypothetical protein
MHGGRRVIPAAGLGGHQKPTIPSAMAAADGLRALWRRRAHTAERAVLNEGDGRRRRDRRERNGDIWMVCGWMLRVGWESERY